MRARKERARRFVARVRRLTVCAVCGAQPIEWHHPDHVDDPARRVGVLALYGSAFWVLKREIRACMPLCRRCHMQEDGRLRRLIDQGFRRPEAPPLPCQLCGRLFKPLRVGLCAACYARTVTRADSGPPNDEKTHCPQGHEYTPENTFVGLQRGHRQRRECRTCQRIRARLAYATKRRARLAAQAQTLQPPLTGL